MRPRAVIVAGVAICAGMALPANAASPEPVEVARSGDVKLLAGDDGDKDLCISVDAISEACAEANSSVAAIGGLTSEGQYVGAAVPSAAISIEVRRAGALLVAGPTGAGAEYKGLRAGSVRFALVRLPKAVRTDGLRVRALNGAGALVEALAVDDVEERIVSRTRLLSDRTGARRWRVVAEQVSELTPSILDPEKESQARCVVTAVDSLDRGRVCSGGLLAQEVGFLATARAAGTETCNGPLRLVHGVVDGSVTAVSVLLGDGRRRTVGTVPVGDGRRTYAVASGPGAVRSVTLGGTVVVPTALAPLSAFCAGGGQGLEFFSFGTSALGLFAFLSDRPPVTPAGPVAAIAVTPAMQVADGPADTLCIALAGKPFDAFGCSIVPPRGAHGMYDSLLDPKAFAVAVPASVVAIRFGTADGKVMRTVATDAGAAYRGRYAGAVRFAAASISGYAELARFELLDAGGAVVYREDADAGDDLAILLPRIGPARRVAGREGGPSLWQTNARYAQVVDRCLSLTQGPPPGPRDNCQKSREDTTVLLDSSCATRRLSAGIAVSVGTRVVADTGRRFKLPVRLRRGLGILTLSPSRPLRSLTFISGGRKRRVQIGAPAGAKQCGWRLAPNVEE